MRFLWLFVPRDWTERMIFGDAPTVLHEGPRNNGFAEIRLATDQEVGLWTRKALSAPRHGPETQPCYIP